MNNLNELRDEVYKDAVAHGLWDGNALPTDCADLVKDEADELYDASVEWADDDYNEPDSFIEELADVIITCLSVAGELDIDIDGAVRRKMEINKTRSWKHGKK